MFLSGNLRWHKYFRFSFSWSWKKLLGFRKYKWVCKKCCVLLMKICVSCGQLISSNPTQLNWVNTLVQQETGIYILPTSQKHLVKSEHLKKYNHLNTRYITLSRFCYSSNSIWNKKFRLGDGGPDSSHVFSFTLKNEDISYVSFQFYHRNDDGYRFCITHLWRPI